MTPPETFRPQVRPLPAIAVSIASTASGVAPTATLPVEVLTKSAPPRIAARAAAPTVSGSPSSPVSRITFSRVRTPQAVLQASTNSTHSSSFPASQARHGKTTSISSTPSLTARNTSNAASDELSSPAGKFATVAARMPESRNSTTGTSACFGPTHTAAGLTGDSSARSHRAMIVWSVSSSLRLV